MEMYTILYAFMASKLRLHGAAKEVFAVIFGFWRKKKQPVEIANSVIQNITGFSHATIIEAKNQLVSQKLILVKEIRGKPSMYEVVLPPDLSIDWTCIDYPIKVSDNQTGLENRPITNCKKVKNNKHHGNQSIDVGGPKEFEEPDQI